MAHHKHRRPKNRRSGCLLCKPWKMNGFTKDLDRLYVEGHEKRSEELDWAEASVKLLSKRLPKEKW